jgi:hypothetical protein
MKSFWLTGSIIFMVMILIVAFENIQAQCSYVNFLFYEVGTEVSPLFTFMGISLLGMITGFFLFGMVNSVFKSSAEEEEDNSEIATM